MQYNIVAINVFTSKRRVIPLRAELPREEVEREVDLMNAQAGSPWHYVLTTQQA
jgi:hypothetical protein